MIKKIYLPPIMNIHFFQKVTNMMQLGMRMKCDVLWY